MVIFDLSPVGCLLSLPVLITDSKPAELHVFATHACSFTGKTVGDLLPESFPFNSAPSISCRSVKTASYFHLLNADNETVCWLKIQLSV